MISKKYRLNVVSLLVLYLVFSTFCLGCNKKSVSSQGTTEDLTQNAPPVVIQENNHRPSSETYFHWKKSFIDRANFSKDTLWKNILYYKTSYSWQGIDISNGNEVWKNNKEIEPYIHQLLAGNDMFYLFLIKDEVDRLEALTKDTMELSWVHTLDHPRYGSITLYKDLILYGSFNGYIYALDALKGSLRWRFSFEEAVGKDFYQHNDEVISMGRNGAINISSDLYIHNDVLYCYYNGENQNYYPDNDGLLYAIDLTTQKLRWKVLTPWPIVSDLLFSTSDNGQESVFFNTMDGFVYAVDLDSKKVSKNLVQIAEENSGPGGSSLVSVTDDLFVFLIRHEKIVAVPRDNLSEIQWPSYFPYQGNALFHAMNYSHRCFYTYQIELSSPQDNKVKLDVLVFSNDSRSIYFIDLASGKEIGSWVCRGDQYGWGPIIPHKDTVIASDSRAIYALDLKKVISQWLEEKETIEIRAGG